jgi:acylphosphatase
MNDHVCRRLRIHGLVQGVGFRFSLQREALRLGLTGWVRNRHDGTVEAIASGPSSAVDALVAWSRHGPPASRVDSVSVSIDDGRFESFDQGPTA